MKTAGSAVFLIACLLACASSAQADGKLDRARDEIRDGADDDDRDSDESSDEGSWAGDLVVGFFDALFSDDEQSADNGDPAAPYVPPEPESPEFGYSSYPYERPDAHYIVERDRQLAYVPSPAHGDIDPSFAPLHAQPLAGQLAIEGGHWEGVSRGGFSARLLSNTRLELDARGIWLHEPASDSADALLGDAHASFRFAQTDALLIRLGLGLRFWADDEIGNAGLDALLGMDFFPVRPLVVSAQISGGNLGQAAVGSARLQLGVSLQRLELLAGFEWLRIGDVDLSSPVIGLRMWL